MRNASWWACALLLALVAVEIAQAFYLPGTAPINYEQDDILQLKAKKLSSVKTQLPYDYYSLPFCANKDSGTGDETSTENLGEILSGDRIEITPYQIYALNEENCKPLCNRTYSPEELKIFKERVQEEYRVLWLLDNLPAATKIPHFADGIEIETLEEGFPLGHESEDHHVYLNNHVDMVIQYHQEPTYPGVRIVGFLVNAKSIKHGLQFDEKGLETCAADKVPEKLSLDDVTKSLTVVWTYSVHWEASAHKWATRWDTYLQMKDNQIHWFSIINSLVIVLFLTGLVAMILLRTIHSDIRRFSDPESSVEEVGWKMVPGDVFRAPEHAGLFAVSVGTGVQILCMAVVTLIFAVLGFLSPANRGALMTALLVVFVLMGAFAGYFSARVYKMFKLQEWKRCAIMTALFYPGIVFTIFLILNFFILSAKSSGAVPFVTLLSLMALWFGVSVPLVFLGSYFGFRKPAIEHPVRVNVIPRQIPEQVWYMKPTFSVLMGGILPFGAVFIELFFILSSIWLHQYYYLFGFLFMVFLILVLTSAEITIVLCYFQLCAEDYRWWWRAFLTSGASALYMFLYSVFYFFANLTITKFVSVLLYFGYTFIMATTFFLLTGTIGFYACFFFLRRLYKSIKMS